MYQTNDMQVFNESRILSKQLKIKKINMNNKNGLGSTTSILPIKRKKENRFAADKAWKKCGFPDAPTLMKWLFENHFILRDNLPAQIFLERGLMDYSIGDVYYSDRCRTGRMKRDPRNPIQVHFTKRGVAYFKNLFLHENQLKKVVAEMKKPWRPLKAININSNFKTFYK